MSKSQIRLALLPVVVVVAIACSGAATPAPTATTAPTAVVTAAPTEDPFAKEWADLIAAAQDEGELVLVGGPEGSEQDGAFYQAFADQFGISPTLVGGPTQDTTTRILAEIAQGVYSIDIASLGGTGTRNFLEADIFEPLEPQIFHPEALDRSTGWRVDHEIWFDPDSTYCQFIAWESQGNILELYYNTEKVTQEELDSIQSWQDLLDPEWNSRIVIGDIASGENSTSRTYAWLFLGPDWLDKLLRNDPHVVLYGDERTFADGLARGEWHIGLFTPGTASLEDAIDAGLPVAEFPRTLAEGSLHAGGQRLCLMVNAPHPNAAKLFINWALSRDGQTAFNQFTQRVGRVALRSDVPEGIITDDVWTRANDSGPFVDQNSFEFLSALDESTEWLNAKFEELGLVPGS